MNLGNWKTALCASSSAVLCGVAYNFYKNRTKSNDASINEILIYGSKDKTKNRELGLNNLLCIYYIVLHATDAVDVCLPSLLSETIKQCLIKVKQNNRAEVRVILHSPEESADVLRFQENGIEVKIVESHEKLEHEFILVDAGKKIEDAVAIVGAIDYETGRVNCNRSTTMLTSEETVLVSLKREFERLWNMGNSVNIKKELDTSE